MLRLPHSILIMISGTIWLCVSLYLFPLGVSLLTGVSHFSHSDLQTAYPLVSMLSAYVGDPETTATLLMAFGLLLGIFKARTVISKAVIRIISRIDSLPNPTELTNLFDRRYLMLVGLMMALGMGMRFFGVPNDVRGLIDVTVGSALLMGAVQFYRQALSRILSKSCASDASD